MWLVLKICSESIFKNIILLSWIASDAIESNIFFFGKSYFHVLFWYYQVENVKKLLFFRYTYGKPVKGDVTLTFLPLSFWGMKKNITKNFKVTFTEILWPQMGKHYMYTFTRNKISYWINKIECKKIESFLELDGWESTHLYSRAIIFCDSVWILFLKFELLKWRIKLNYFKQNR